VSRDATIRLEWGDGEHTFRLAILQLEELQEKLDLGPEEIAERLLGITWRTQHVREVLRIGLIGGGAKPEEALALVKRYVDQSPWTANKHIARAVLLAALVGARDEPVGKGQRARRPSASPSPASTKPAALSDGPLTRSAE
jgi:hypothetical protein